MKTTILAAALLAGAALPAWANTAPQAAPHWWIKHDTSCEDASTFAETNHAPEMADPAALAKLTDAKVDTTQSPATIVYPQKVAKGQVVVYLPSRAQCEAVTLHDDTPPPVPGDQSTDIDFNKLAAKVTKMVSQQPAAEHAPVGANALSGSGAKFCVITQAQADAQYLQYYAERMLAGDTKTANDPRLGHPIPDPIAACHVTIDSVPDAMDAIMQLYTFFHGRREITWVTEHCHAEVAMPRNKWVCTYNGVTQEYR